jgi:Chemoreceptor zinc-binding domain
LEGKLRREAKYGARMDLNDAISAHIEWSEILLHAIDESAEGLDVQVICQDNQCRLGKWIYGDGTEYKHKPSYEPLRLAHAEFHICAADVLRLNNAGDKMGADILLNGEYFKKSLRTIREIEALKKEL